MPLSEPTFLDLFCGAGGLTLGFTQAGFNCVWAADSNMAAVETHRANSASPVCCLDLSTFNAGQMRAADVVVGGPPCQGFSSAGLRQQGDARNDLVAQFARLVKGVKPVAFLFENVEGFLTAERGYYLFALVRPLIACGYRIHVRKVNAANYGVAQHRKRVIVLGGLGWDPSFPGVTHSAFGAPGAALGGASLPRTPTLQQALAGLPPASIDLSGRLEGHAYRPLRSVDMARALLLRPGESMRDLPPELQHESFARRASRRVRDGMPSERRGGAPTGVRRLRADEPSKAVTGGARSEFLHPVEHRPLTLRECARLQTFPDDFKFCGTASQQSQLIGNAVPPLLAQAFAQSMRRDLLCRDVIGAGVGHGGLLSFIPTLSEGTSPALKHVIKAIRHEFGCHSTAQEQQTIEELLA